MRILAAAALAVLFAAPLFAVEIEVGVDPRFELDAAWQAKHVTAPAAPVDPVLRAQILARLTPPPDLREAVPLSSWQVTQAGGRDALEAWLGALRAFARDSRFMDSFSTAPASLKPALETLRSSVAAAGYIAAAEAYTGLAYEGRYRLVLSPSYPARSVANDVAFLDDGGYQVTSVIGPDPADGTAPPFNDVPAIVWHETAHGLLDVLAEIHDERIAASSPRFRDLPLDCYGDWQHCVKEHVVRAVMLRLIALHIGENAARARLEIENPKRFPFLEPMVDALRRYEGDRAKWKSLAAFYPELLKTLGEAKAGDASASREGADTFSDAAAAFPSAGQRARALRALEAALAGGPSAALLVRRAALELSGGDAKAAAADASAALGLEPKAPGALLARSLARAGSGDKAGARADYDAALASCAGKGGGAAACRDLRIKAGGFDAGILAHLSVDAGPEKEGAAPVEVAKDAPDSKTPDPAFYKRRATSRFRAGDLAGALADVDRALGTDSNDPEGLMDRGVILHALKRYDEALASYGRGLDLAAADPEPRSRDIAAGLYTCRASVWAAQGKADLERADLVRALDRATPHWFRRAETERRLAALPAR